MHHTIITHKKLFTLSIFGREGGGPGLGRWPGLGDLSQGGDEAQAGDDNQEQEDAGPRPDPEAAENEFQDLQHGSF